MQAGATWELLQRQGCALYFLQASMQRGTLDIYIYILSAVCKMLGLEKTQAGGNGCEIQVKERRFLTPTEEARCVPKVAAPPPRQSVPRSQKYGMRNPVSCPPARQDSGWRWL